MTEKDLLTAFSEANEDYIEHAATALEGRKKPAGGWRRVALIAACMTLIIAAILPIAKVALSPTPVSEIEITLSAEDISLFFNDQTEGLTQQYGTSFTPDHSYLNLSPITNQEYYPIYQADSKGKTINKKEFECFIQQYIEPLAKATGLSVPDYEIEEKDWELNDSEDSKFYDLYVEANEDHYFDGAQTSTKQSIGINPKSTAKDIYLDGEPIAVDQTQSNEEIIASLSNIRKKFGKIFGENFTHTKVIRYYNGYSSTGVSNLIVYFYNEADHPLNSLRNTPFSNYVSLYFDNFRNFEGDFVSNDRLTKVDIEYVQMRSEPCKQIGIAKSMPLQKAEELLAQGYCFMAHACPLCAEQQEAIEFTEYDFVSIKYIFESNSNDSKPLRGVPFYVFYKYIGDASNGNRTYAFTYVPAVEVSGLEEYFQNQIQNHPK